MSGGGAGPAPPHVKDSGPCSGSCGAGSGPAGCPPAAHARICPGPLWPAFFLGSSASSRRQAEPASSPVARQHRRLRECGVGGVNAKARVC